MIWFNFVKRKILKVGLWFNFKIKKNSGIDVVRSGHGSTIYPRQECSEQSHTFFNEFLGILISWKSLDDCLYNTNSRCYLTFHAQQFHLTLYREKQSHTEYLNNLSQKKSCIHHKLSLLSWGFIILPFDCILCKQKSVKLEAEKSNNIKEIFILGEP